MLIQNAVDFLFDTFSVFALAIESIGNDMLLMLSAIQLKSKINPDLLNMSYISLLLPNFLI